MSWGHRIKSSCQWSVRRLAGACWGALLAQPAVERLGAGVPTKDTAGVIGRLPQQAHMTVSSPPDVCEHTTCPAVAAQ